jgi:hypothetical protein
MSGATAAQEISAIHPKGKAFPFSMKIDSLA